MATYLHVLVRDANTSNPIQGAQVDADPKDTSDPDPDPVTTGADGRATIEFVGLIGTAKYYVTATATGHLEETHTVTMIANTPHDVETFDLFPG